jgi:phosphoserine phosphatase
LGVTEILATDAQIVDGRYSGKVEGVPTYKEGKVVRLNAWLKEQGETLKGSLFYSDSINDLPLLLEVDRAVAVDPCPALQAIAEEKHWQIISLRD